MTEETKKRLRGYPKKRCSICGTVSSYQNPIARCFECRNSFCYDHINGGQIKDSMREGDDIRDICERCAEEHGYRTI